MYRKVVLVANVNCNIADSRENNVTLLLFNDSNNIRKFFHFNTFCINPEYTKNTTSITKHGKLAIIIVAISRPIGT